MLSLQHSVLSLKLGKIFKVSNHVINWKLVWISSVKSRNHENSKIGKTANYECSWLQFKDLLTFLTSVSSLT